MTPDMYSFYSHPHEILNQSKFTKARFCFFKSCVALGFFGIAAVVEFVVVASLAKTVVDGVTLVTGTIDCCDS